MKHSSGQKLHFLETQGWGLGWTLLLLSPFLFAEANVDDGDGDDPAAVGVVKEEGGGPIIENPSARLSFPSSLPPLFSSPEKLFGAKKELKQRISFHLSCLATFSPPSGGKEKAALTVAPEKKKLLNASFPFSLWPAMLT